MTSDAAPTFTINGSAVPLVPQAREPFSWLASQVYRRLHDGAPLPALLGMLAHEGLTTQSLPPQDARLQAILWTLRQLGLTGLKVEGEGAHTIADEELLMDQLERREALMEAENPAEVEAIARQAKLDAEAALSALASNFASGDKIAAKRGYLRLKYLVKLGEEARARRARLTLAR